MKDMAKKTVSTRVRREIAEQVDRYAEMHEISRTEALTRFARIGIEEPERAEGERAYTGVIPVKSVDEAEEGRKMDNFGSIEDKVRFGLSRLREPESLPVEYGEEVARSARMPPELVGRLDERAESQDSSRAVVAAEAITTGLKSDPVPDEERGGRQGRPYTVVLDRETAEIFRKYRLSSRKMPGEVFETALKMAESTKPVVTDW